MSLPAVSGLAGVSAQAGRIEGRKDCLWSHAFSNLKIVDFGIAVDMERRIGVWSEVGLGWGSKEVDGNAMVCWRLTRARSSFSKVGGSWPLDQVKRRPSNGISMAPRVEIVSLKAWMR